MHEERKRILQELITLEGLIVYDVQDVNHKPHPYTVGPRHVKHASDNHGGSLGEETLKAVPCAQPKCKLSYGEHTYDRVCFLQLQKDLKTTDIQEALKELTEKMPEYIVDGFAFIESDYEMLD